MAEVKMPTPLWSEVLVDNPMKDEKQTEELEKKAKLLPQGEREKFLSKHISDMWSSVEILAVGPDCRALNVGDKAIGSPETIHSAMPSPCGNYLFVNERGFKGRW